MVTKGDDSADNYTLLKEIFLWLDNGDRRMLQKHNLSTARFNVLCHLSCHGPLNQTALRSLLICDKANVTRLLNGMEADHLICRKKDPADTRCSIVALTETGFEVWEKASIAHQEFTDRRFQCLSPEEQKTLSGNLLRLLATLQTQLLNG